MPSRILKDSICTSDSIDTLTPFQETFFYRLIVNCDDYGRMDGRAKILASKLYPLKDIRANQIEDALRALASAELVSTYIVDGKPFVQIVNWERHQQVRAARSKYPAPTDEAISLANTCNHLQSSDSKCARNPIQSESLSESNSVSVPTSGKAQTQRFVKPSVGEVRAYCTEKGFKVDAERFVDFYESKGWLVGKSPMKDWKACVRTWNKGDASPAPIVRKKVVGDQQYQQREYEEKTDLDLALDFMGGG